MKKVSVFALYLLFVLNQRARFVSFDLRSHLEPQLVIPNWSFENISEQYISQLQPTYSFTLNIKKNNLFNPLV